MSFLVVNDQWRIPEFAFTGQEVLVPYRHKGKYTGLRCKVVAASGYHARAVNEKYGVDRWFDIHDIREPVPPGEQALKRLRDPA